jgi:hypothetical protein
MPPSRKIVWDVGTSLRQDLRDAFADAASGPGDKDDFACDVIFCRLHAILSLSRKAP